MTSIARDRLLLLFYIVLLGIAMISGMVLGNMMGKSDASHARQEKATCKTIPILELRTANGIITYDCENRP